MCVCVCVCVHLCVCMIPVLFNFGLNLSINLYKLGERCQRRLVFVSFSLIRSSDQLYVHTTLTHIYT